MQMLQRSCAGEFRIHSLTGNRRDAHAFDHWDTCPHCRAMFEALPRLNELSKTANQQAARAASPFGMKDTGIP